jgi:hypothetical protein
MKRTNIIIFAASEMKTKIDRGLESINFGHCMALKGGTIPNMFRSVCNFGV